jgi:hypothetical protein
MPEIISNKNNISGRARKKTIKRAANWLPSNTAYLIFGFKRPESYSIYMASRLMGLILDALPAVPNAS